MSKIVDYKQELINRYKYLYENVTYILASYMYKETEDDIKKRLRKLCCSEEELTKKALISRKKLDIDMLSLLEEFLLGDIFFKDTVFYNYLEEKKNDPIYLKRVNEGIRLYEEYSVQTKKIWVKSYLTLWSLLEEVRKYIDAQTGDLKNKDKKIRILDEYFRLFRYKNDGKIWTSGYNLNSSDFINNYVTDSYYSPVDSSIKKRKNNDIGVTRNSFIDHFMMIPKNVINGSWLTEKEKQEVYLCYHDELPYGYLLGCGDYSDNMYDIRPKGTSCCSNVFTMNEEEIFVYNDKYFQLCPHCGYIVCVDDAIEGVLSDTIKKRIKKRCEKDPELYKRMYLYSELKNLEDKLPDEGYIKVLKKKK